MTPEILEYLLRASFIWLTLLAYYFISGRKASFRFQRFFLLGGWVFGLLVPLLPSVAGEVSLPVVNLPTVSFSGPVVAVPTAESEVVATWSFTDFLPWLYLLGVLVFTARTLVQGWVTEQYLRTGQRSAFSGHPVVRHQGIQSPFAARGYVFLPASITDADLEYTALIHETSHLRARHHYDKFLLTLGSILLWFHPLVWVYRRLLATVHEYEADAAVLLRVPARTYGLQLLHCSLGPARGLGLFSSPLKQRIEMITNKTSRRKLRLLPLLGLCLLLLGLTVACSDVVAQGLLPERNDDNVNMPILGLTITDEVDEYPRLLSASTGVAANDALISAIESEIKYPQEGLDKACMGRVVANLLIDETGDVADVTLVREAFGEDESKANNFIIKTPYPKSDITIGLDFPYFSDEVQRTIDKLGKFKPATKDGKPIAVMLVLDFDFFFDFKD